MMVICDLFLYLVVFIVNDLMLKLCWENSVVICVSMLGLFLINIDNVCVFGFIRCGFW